MSLSTRVISGLAAAAVVGAGLAGYGIYWAVDKGAPAKNEATLVVGTTSVTTPPFCYNDGKPLDEATLNKCVEDGQAATDKKTGQIPRIDVRASDRIGVGVSKDMADKGWFALTDGGTSNRATIANNLTGTTFSGTVQASTVMKSGDLTSVTVVAQDPKTEEYYAVWFFDLNNKTS
ncbi:DUF2771 family protein [Streptomyces sp. TLI_171]|uniref:DUF2771 family protein n=1 Tax=Streptomyces sp. TLI_171 TaxID=1938859 RepID=UPI000C17DBE5|nr:DUF2771 family protein [Streptomyces sp. TLI_171]RKE20651.1 uncharacterized protein DUF2771 [Streptomyces sp. TLI_171]